MNSSGDVKELIPEFYNVSMIEEEGEEGNFLVNGRGLELGVRQVGGKVDAVALPRWAKGMKSGSNKGKEGEEGKEGEDK